MKKQRSLQRELSRWIIITALILVILGGSIAGILAFKQARELQDNTLKEISLLVRNGQLDFSEFNKASQESRHSSKHKRKRYKKHHDEDEEETTIIVHEIGKSQFLPGLPKNIKNGLQTVRLKDEEWRVLTITQYDSKRRFSIAQPTELRDQIAFSSAISTLLPILILVAILLLIIHIIIRRQFKSLNQLAKTIDQQDGVKLAELSENNIPQEILPFVDSINALISRVRNVMQKQQRFIADAAHELRTPITALSLQAENLKKAKNTSERNDRQQNLQHGFDRLGTLVSQLLDLARLQSEAEVESQTVSFNEIVKNTIADLYPLAESANIDLGMLRNESDINVKDQNGGLGQLIHNAIGNAIHYTPESGKVDISLYKENSNAVLLVEDTGIGIPEKDLAQVMQPFYRVLESGQPGNGLGLAISNEIAERLGGKISLSNRKMGGLRFRYEQTLVSK